VIDRPGPCETTLLADINGDGQPDLLPHVNLTGETAWYELARDPAGRFGVKWIKHGVHMGEYVHGLGAGDVNGDDRCDILRPDGWLEQPDRADGTWTYHKEWIAVARPKHPLPEKYTDAVGRASMPMLAHDVDDDGDTDIIYGMGHDFGLYWLEQTRNAAGKRAWTKHEIDYGWSQAHHPILADLDGDGRKELIVGKRYHAHNGRDPGGNDRPCIYYYHWIPEQQRWQRHTVQEGGPAGWGINTQVIDLDGDGDCDLIAPGKTGLYWFENVGDKAP
jgi:hypothetical protein